MKFSDDQVQQRRSNLEALAALGIEIYPRTFERRHTIAELVESYGSARTTSSRPNASRR